jgi:hypothetical protein
MQTDKFEIIRSTNDGTVSLGRFPAVHEKAARAFADLAALSDFYTVIIKRLNSDGVVIGIELVDSWIARTNMQDAGLMISRKAERMERPEA